MDNLTRKWFSLAHLQKRWYESFNKATTMQPPMQHDPASPTGDARPVFKVFKCRARLTPASHRRLGEVFRLCCGFYNAALEERIGAWMKAGVSISCSDQCKVFDGDPQQHAISRVRRPQRSGVPGGPAAAGPKLPGFLPARGRRRQARLSALQGGAAVADGGDRGGLAGHGAAAWPALAATCEGASAAATADVAGVAGGGGTEDAAGGAEDRCAPRFTWVSRSRRSPRKRRLSRSASRPVGIDAGVAKQLTLSDGGEVAKREVDRGRLRRLQRAVARAAPGSGNRRKKVGSLAREWQRISGRQPASPAPDGVGAQPGLRFFRDRRLADRQPIALGEGDRGGTRTQCAGQGGAEPGDLRAGMGNVFHALEGQGCERRPSGGGSRAAWNQPGLLGMRRRGAENTGCSRPRLSGLRAGAGPRCQCGKEYPATGFGPFTGREWRGDPASRGGGRSGEPIILRSKRGSGAARRRTVSCRVM